MSCFGPNYNPEPTREWSRYENPCAYSNNPLVLYNGIAYKLDVLKKGNVLQYKKNSSNITKQQRYAQIARGMWTNRTTTWATQTQSYTNPNTNSLRRLGYTTTIKKNFVPLNKLSDSIIYQPTSLPITCPPTIATNVFDSLPINNGDNQQADSTPTIPPQEYPDPIAPLNPIIPPIVQVEPPETVLIPDGGTLICNVSENPCTGEIYSSTENNFCNPTTASDVPGPIISLCYNDGLPTYYPRERRTYSAGGNKWPQGEKIINSAVEPFFQPQTFIPATATIGNTIVNNNTYGNSGVYGGANNYNVLVNQYKNLEKMIIDSTNQIVENETNIARQIYDATTAISETERNLAWNIDASREALIDKEESIKQQMQYYIGALVDKILANDYAHKKEIVETTNDAKDKIIENTSSEFTKFSTSFSNQITGIFTNLVPNQSTMNSQIMRPFSGDGDEIMYPQTDETLIASAAKAFKDYFEEKFSGNKNQFTTLQTDLINTKNAIIENEHLIKMQIEQRPTKDELKEELATNTSNVFNSLAQNINMVFSSVTPAISSQLNDELIPQQLDDEIMHPQLDEQANHAVMSPQLDNALLTSASQTFKNYFDNRFLLNTNQFNAIQSSILQTEIDIKSYVSDKIEDNATITNNKITELSDTISDENVYINQQLTNNKELIMSSVTESESNLKLYINETNEDHENEYKTYINQQFQLTNANIGGKIDTIKSDVTGLINATKAEIISSNATISGKIDTAKSDITGLINTTKSDVTGLINATKAEIISSNATISGKIDTAKSDITGLINTTKEDIVCLINANKEELISSNATISGKIDTAKSDITGLINTTKAQIDASHATISGKIDIAKSDITGLITTAKAEIVAGNAIISGKMDTIKSDITGLINTTKAQLETIIQSVVTSNNQIFILLSAVAANGTGGNGNGNGNGTGTIQETMIHTLLISETVSTIMTYYSDLADGNFEALSAELTGEKFTQLSKELFDFKSGLAVNSDYETIRRIIVTSFEALMRMVTTNIAYLELQNNYEVVFNRSKILDNIELLKEYIDALNNSGNLSIIPEISIVAPFIELRPEIQAYIDKYGLPEDGVFNPDKLAELL
jgi:hypothetical protein